MDIEMSDEPVAVTNEELVQELRLLADRASFKPHMFHIAADVIETLLRENARLNQCLKWEQHKTAQANGTTHSENCHTWGPQHYECLLRKAEAMEDKGQKLLDALLVRFPDLKEHPDLIHSTDIGKGLLKAIRDFHMAWADYGVEKILKMSDNDARAALQEIP
jgi:hypothetical protein